MAAIPIETEAMQANASSSASVVQAQQCQPTRDDGSAEAFLTGHEGGVHPAHESAHFSDPHIQPAKQPQHDDDWQFVNDQAAACRLQGQPLLAAAGKHEAYNRDQDELKNSLMAAMSTIKWPLSSTYPADCRFATLLEIR